VDVSYRTFTEQPAVHSLPLDGLQQDIPLTISLL
jgi:hypothetical protein